MRRGTLSKFTSPIVHTIITSLSFSVKKYYRLVLLSHPFVIIYRFRFCSISEEQEVKEIPDEKWISKKRVKREFPPMEPDIPKEIFNLVNVAKCQKEGYYVEMGVRTAPKNPPLEIEYTEEYIPYYAEYFAAIGMKFTKSHTHTHSFALIINNIISYI
jgi:hypothetical protein